MAEIETKVRNLAELLRCPACHADLAAGESELKCGSGHGPFLVDKNGRAHLILGDVSEYQGEHLRGVNWLKSFLKRWPRLYYFVWHIFCPVLMSDKGPRSILPLVSSSNPLIINLGSGPKRIGREFVNLDVFPFAEVDVVADAHHLPFADNSVDAVFNESLLEHVANPLAAVLEIARVIKPGGIIYTSAPFMTPYHASPDDFGRWTKSGLKTLFSNFEPVEEGVASGPWSALLVFLAYFLGVVFSFGSRKLAPFLAFVFMIILGPLKIFDFIFARFPGADAVSAQLYFIGRKR